MEEKGTEILQTAERDSPKILVVVTVGGSTNVAPIMNICSILAQRGFSIEFATLEGRQHLVNLYPFVSATYTLGQGPTSEDDEQLYSRLTEWNSNTPAGKRTIVWVKQFQDSFWLTAYQHLKGVISETKPDLVFTDYQVDAARDVAHEMNVPLAVMWCQMPWLMMPLKYIPGQPGMQSRCLTSENASISDRLFDETYLLRSAPYVLSYFRWFRRLRGNAGAVNSPPPSKPDHLLFVNSFWGLEPPKDVPPLVHAVGPILADTYDALDALQESFLSRHQRVAYVAFGTHVLLNAHMLCKIVNGLSTAIREGHIDGVFWALKASTRALIETSESITGPQGPVLLSELFNNHTDHWYFVDFSSQRAVLAHDTVKLFVTHAGPSSANEAIFHGVPMLAIPIYGDQHPHSLRLIEAGVAMRLDKDQFTAADLAFCVTSLVRDEAGLLGRNIVRMQRIARITAKRKFLAADIIEEYLADWDLRFERTCQQLSDGYQDRGKPLRPMHLQTADARMSWLKKNNIDLYAVVAVGLPVWLLYFIWLILIALW